MNGCGGESVTVDVSVSLADGGYEALVTDAMRKLSEHLPDCKIHRRRADCEGDGAGKDEWYIGCAHSGISGGGQQIIGKFTFLRWGSEEAF